MKFLRRNQREADLDAEIRNHLDEAIRDRIERGETPDEARANALREFGNVGLVKEVTREMWGWTALERLLQDLRYGARLLVKRPGFTVIAVLTLALGIGVNTAMFSIVDVLLLRPPPHVRDADEIVRVYPKGWWKSESRSYPDYTDLRDGASAFSAVAAYQPDIKRTVGRGSHAQQVSGARATARFFPLLGVQPALGRFFTAEEDGAPQAAPVVVISYEFWQRYFNGAPDVVGRLIQFGQHPYTIIGVAPAGFTGVELKAADFWQPLGTITQEENWQTWPAERGSHWLRIIARLKPGIARAAADRDANVANQRGWVASGLKSDGELMRIGPLLRARDIEQSKEVKVALWLTWVAATVLLIACANVANLLLTRAGERRHEIAVRLALGAGRRRIVQQLLVESLLLSATGGVAALLVAVWGAPLVRAFVLPENVSDLKLDVRVLLFTLGAALLTGLLCGLAPAWQTSRPDLTMALKTGAADRTAHRSRTRAALLVAQVALTLVLLIGAGLFIRSLRAASAVEIGFDAEPLLTLTTRLELDGYSEQQSDDVYRRMREVLRGMPGIEQASLTVAAPFRSGRLQRLIPQGRAGIKPPQFGRDFFNEQINCVTPDFFAATGIKILRGRGFTEADRAGAPPVLIVNESLARMIAPGGDALGQRFHIQTGQAPLAEIVGIAADSKTSQVLGKFDPQYYVPFDQPLVNGKGTLRALLIRTGGDAEHSVEPVRRALQTAFPDLPYLDIKSLQREIAPQLLVWRLGATVFSLFGALALAMAAIGLYGVLAYSVTQRTHEIGIRLALGAQTYTVLKLILGQGMKLASAGVMIGLVGALALTRLLKTLLFGVSATDPLTFALIAALLLGVALLACWIPARRATKVDPLIALRCE